MKNKIKKLIYKIKNFEFPYKIIKKEEYKILKEVAEDYEKLCKQKNIEPTNIIEEMFLCSPLMTLGTGMLLRQLKKFKKGK